MKKLISIIGPMFNEEAIVGQFCSEIINTFRSIADRYDLELVLVDDGSKDETLNQMRVLHERFPEVISVVQLSRNFGLEGAIQAGLRMAAGDAVVVMDADLQDPPHVVLEMVREWELGADIVIGSRAGRPSDSLFKRLSAKFFYRTLSAFSGKLHLEKEAANFRLLDRKAVLAVLSLPEVNSVFRVVVPFVGMKTSVVSYDRDKRFAGETKYRLKSMIRYALDSVAGISIEPLRKIPLAVMASLILTGCSIIGLIAAPGEWKPFLFICVVICILFALLFLVLSVIAEYLAQVYLEAKARPGSLIYDFSPSESSRNRVSHEKLS